MSPRHRAQLGIGGDLQEYFRSVYAACPNPEDEGEDFTGASWSVRCVFFCLIIYVVLVMFSSLSCLRFFIKSDTLEQIDVSKLLIEKYPDVWRLQSILV